VIVAIPWVFDIFTAATQMRLGLRPPYLTAMHLNIRIRMQSLPLCATLFILDEGKCEFMVLSQLESMPVSNWNICGQYTG
jgi:hypothetical protein